MKKKLLSLLLVLLMLASLLPASALAANKTFGDFFAGLPLIAETEPGSPNSTKKWKVTTLGGEDVRQQRQIKQLQHAEAYHDRRYKPYL